MAGHDERTVRTQRCLAASRFADRRQPRALRGRLPQQRDMHGIRRRSPYPPGRPDRGSDRVGVLRCAGGIAGRIARTRQRRSHFAGRAGKRVAGVVAPHRGARHSFTTRTTSPARSRATPPLAKSYARPESTFTPRSTTSILPPKKCAGRRGARIAYSLRTGAGGSNSVPWRRARRFPRRRRLPDDCSARARSVRAATFQRRKPGDTHRPRVSRALRNRERAFCSSASCSPAPGSIGTANGAIFPA